MSQDNVQREKFFDRIVKTHDGSSARRRLQLTLLANRVGKIFPCLQSPLLFLSWSYFTPDPVTRRGGPIYCGVLDIIYKHIFCVTFISNAELQRLEEKT